MADGVWKGVYSEVFGRSRQLLLNKFFYPSTPSMRKVDDEKKKKKKKKRKEKNDGFSGHYVIASRRPPERRPLERRTLVPKAIHPVDRNFQVSWVTMTIHLVLILGVKSTSTYQIASL